MELYWVIFVGGSSQLLGGGGLYLLLGIVKSNETVDIMLYHKPYFINFSGVST